jgi:transposase InsO family protein
MFYCWGLDFAGSLPKSRRGNQYVLVLVEHFSKHIILVPTRDKEPGTVAEVFTREVLTRFGACAEVVTDRGGKFSGEFQACLDAALIDHHATSAYHPRANGLSERVVGIVKRALRKWCLGHAAEEWDVYLLWVAMGYNFSAQASLAGFSPYHLLFGREPVVPAAIKVALDEALDLDRPERLVALVGQRGELFRRWVPIAMGNLEIAQHRDTLRYAKTRSGTWKPQLVQYGVGDNVYL